MALITLSIIGILAILTGILVLIKPDWVRWALGIYLILVGVLRLVDFAL